MLRVFELNVKNPAFAKQKIAQMRRVFFEFCKSIESQYDYKVTTITCLKTPNALIVSQVFY